MDASLYLIMSSGRLPLRASSHEVREAGDHQKEARPHDSAESATDSAERDSSRSVLFAQCPAAREDRKRRQGHRDDSEDAEVSSRPGPSGTSAAYNSARWVRMFVTRMRYFDERRASRWGQLTARQNAVAKKKTILSRDSSVWYSRCMPATQPPCLMRTLSPHSRFICGLAPTRWNTAHPNSMYSLRIMNAKAIVHRPTTMGVTTYSLYSMSYSEPGPMHRWYQPEIRPQVAPAVRV